MSAIRKACEEAGGASRLAELLRVSPQAVSKWCSANRAPAERCREIEEVTKGAVTRAELRPDLFGPIDSATPNREAA